MKFTGPDSNEANRPRWDRGPSAFYEVWYVIAVEPKSGDGYWIRYTLLNPRAVHPQAGGTVWFAYTCRSDPSRSLTLQQQYPATEVKVGEDGLDLTLGANQENSWAGNLLCGSISMVPTISTGALRSRDPSSPTNRLERLRKAAWRVSLEDDPAFPCEPHGLLPRWLRSWTARRIGASIPLPRLRLKGLVEIDGEPIELAGAIGHQAHHWGIRRADGWDWAHCAHFREDPRAVFEVLAPQLAARRLQPVILRLTTSSGSFEFQGPLEIFRGQSQASLGRFRFVARNRAARLEAEIQCDPKLFAAFTYLSPAYAPSRCWNTQVGDCRIRLDRRGEAPLLLTASGTASAEMHRSRLHELPYETSDLD